MADLVSSNRPLRPPPLFDRHYAGWMIGLSFVVVALTLAGIGLLYWLLPGEIAHAQQREIPGGIELTIQSAKQAWIDRAGLVFLFGIGTLVYWRFRDRLQTHRPRRNPGGAFRAARRVLLVLLAALGLVAVTMEVIVIPLYNIQRITIVGDQVRLDSLYRSWQLPREEFQRVEILRDVRSEPNREPVVEYRARLHRPSGLPFWTSTITTSPPDGRGDRHYQQFFGRLEEEILGHRREALK